MNQEALSDVKEAIAKLKTDREFIDASIARLQLVIDLAEGTPTTKKAVRKSNPAPSTETVTTAAGVVRRKPVWSEEQKLKAKRRMKEYWAKRRGAG